MNEKIELEITDFSNEGDGIGTHDGKIVFVPNVYPGDRVECQIAFEKKSYSKAALIKIINYSKDRIDSPCKYFPECGGCNFQCVNYQYEIEWKQKRIVETLKKIGKIDNPNILPIIKSSVTDRYRNNIQMYLDEKKLGFHKRQSNNIVPVKDCLLYSKTGMQIVSNINDMLEDIDNFSIKSIVFRESSVNSKSMVILRSEKKQKTKILQLAEKIYKTSENINSVFYFDEKKYHKLQGIDYLEEEILGIKYHYGASSFFQINPIQFENFFKTVVNMIGTENDNVVDAYGGVGVFGILLSRYAKSIVTIEKHYESAQFAAENCFINKISNMQIIHGNCDDWIKDNQNYQTIIVDPPRKGMTKRLIENLIQSQAKKILYISCDCATQARDISIMCSQGFNLIKCQPIDLFPRTIHIENIALLQR